MKRHSFPDSHEAACNGIARAMIIASQSAANSKRGRNPLGTFMRLSATSKDGRLRPTGYFLLCSRVFRNRERPQPLGERLAREARKDASRTSSPGQRRLDSSRLTPPFAAMRSTLACAKRRSMDCQRPRISSGGRAIGAQLGHAPAVARRFLVVDPRQDQRGDQPAHFFKRLDAILNPGGLLSGRTLVEHEHERGPDLLDRCARSSAGP